MADLSYLYEDGFDTDKAAEEAGPSGDFPPVPKGTYRVKVVNAEVKETKAGNGEMLKVRLDIIGPEHVGRVVFDDILIKHTSPDAQRIGRERFATLARACGLKNPRGTDPLLGHEIDAFVKVEKNEQHGDRNRVSFYSSPKPQNGFDTGATGASAGFNDDDVPF